MAELLICWVAYPLLLAAVAEGCGALVALAGGRTLPATIRLPCGIALAMAVLDLFTRASATAPAAVWAVVALSVAGWVVSPVPLRVRRRPRRPSGALGAGLIAFGAYAAPIVLSGMATWGGYIKLDDTASWLALVDRALAHGHSIAGLAPSSYQLTLAEYLTVGYPLGAFLPLGLGHTLLGQDIAWLTDPWMGFMGAMLALTLYRIASLTLRASATWQRVAIAAIGAQPALLYGYYLWGGMKELAGAMLIGAFAVTAPLPLGGARRARAAIPALVVAWATVAALSPGGLVWLIPGLALAATLVVAGSWSELRSRIRATAWRPPWEWAAVLAIGAAGAAYLVFRPGGFVERFHNVLTSGGQLGNLAAPLSVLQLAGIWPTGDFRYAPLHLTLTHALVAVATAGAIGALVLAVLERRYELLLLLACAVTGALLVDELASPWLGGKGLATGSIAIPLGALTAAGWLAQRGQPGWERVAGGVLGVLVAGGVVWSNLLGYHAVSLAPRELMAELSTIGTRIAGEGPTFMDEYSAYGDRHFLRDAAPESASELRSRPDYLSAGEELEKGESADIDDFELATVLAYRTLVLQRGPSTSRPPSPYRLLYEDEFWEVWQRPDLIDPPVLRHLPLGTAEQAGSVPRCGDVLALARGRGVSELVAAPAREAVFASVSNGGHPKEWSTSTSQLSLDGAGEATFPVTVPKAGRYRVWLGGSVRGAVTLLIDGSSAGTVRDQLQEPGQDIPFESLRLDAGRHTVQLRYGGGGWRPGSGGPPQLVGPLALSLIAPPQQLLRVAPSRARTLCGRTLDWIDALGPTLP